MIPDYIAAALGLGGVCFGLLAGHAAGYGKGLVAGREEAKRHIRNIIQGRRN